MKLLTLDLLAYGPFTNESLDLSAGHAGLHVIYGANEAGKSSALRALDALLFGMSARTRDNFRHKHDQLRVGGTLRHVDGSMLSVIRRKGNKATLLDLENNPLDEHLFDVMLAGMDSERFTRLFGINHATLQAGGQELLQLGGEVGQSLLAAGIGGGVSISAKLKELDATAENLFQPRAQKMTINALLKEYEEARDRMRKASLSGNEWQQKSKLVSTLDAELQTVKAEIAVLLQQRIRLQRLRNILPDLAARQEVLARQQALGDMQVLPPELPDSYRKVREELQRALETETRAKGAIDSLERQLGALDVPDALLADDVVISDLHQRFGVYDKAQKDRLQLEAKLAQLTKEIEQAVREFPAPLTLDAIFALRVSRAQRTTLRELSETAHKIGMRLERAESDVRKFTRQHAAAEETLHALPPGAECRPLADALARVRKLGDIANGFQRAEANHTDALAVAQRSLARLTGWAGTLEEAEVLAVPSEETILRFSATLRQADTAIAEAQKQIDGLEHALAEVNMQLDDLHRVGEVPTEKDLSLARSARDCRWQHIRRRWIDGSERGEDALATDGLPLPDAYESAVSGADTIADRLRREADRVAQQATLLAGKTRAEGELAQVRERLAGSQREREQLQQEWEQTWESAKLAPTTPEEMRAWLSRFQQVLTAIAQMRASESESQLIRAQLLEARAAISAELVALHDAPMTETESYAALLDRAQATVTQHTEALRKRAEQQAKQQDITRALAEAHDDLSGLEQERQQWQNAWDSAIIPLQISGATLPAEVNAFLEALTAIHEKGANAEALRERVQGIDRDANEFIADVTTLLTRLGMSWGERNVQQVVHDLHTQLLQAREDAATRKGWLEQLTAQREELRTARETQELQQKQLQELCVTAHCSTPEELPPTIARAQLFAQLSEQLKTLEENLHHLGEGLTLAKLENEALGIEPDSLPVQLAECEEMQQTKEAHRDSLQAQLWAAQAELQQMDGASTAADAAATAQQILAGLRAPVEQYMRLRLTARVLRDAIDIYRAQNQSPMLARGSELFSRLTLGAFQAVKVDYDEHDEQVLKGTRPTGEDVDMAGMSDGTRDQLYLALRIASLERYLLDNPPMPFVVDDILITFDDERAVAALSVLAELSQHTQVVFFTHHHRLVELAHGLAQPETIFIQELRT